MGVTLRAGEVTILMVIVGDVSWYEAALSPPSCKVMGKLAAAWV